MTRREWRHRQFIVWFNHSGVELLVELVFFVLMIGVMVIGIRLVGR